MIQSTRIMALPSAELEPHITDFSHLKGNATYAINALTNRLSPDSDKQLSLFERIRNTGVLKHALANLDEDELIHLLNLADDLTVSFIEGERIREALGKSDKAESTAKDLLYGTIVAVRQISSLKSASGATY